MKKLASNTISHIARAFEVVSDALKVGKKTNVIRITTPFPNPSLITHVLEAVSASRKSFVLVSTLDEYEINVALDVVGATELKAAIEAYLVDASGVE
jgi:hypothetical protein